MTLQATLRMRDFSAILAPPKAVLTVERYSWAAIGGPELATIQVTGSEQALWEFIEMLRCPVEIHDEYGELRWWGMVATVDLLANAINLSVSLDTMANKVAVAYAYVPAGSATIGTRATTNWAQDDASVAEYGIFERLESSSSEETISATTLRDTVLAQNKYPVPAPTVTPGQQGFQATLTCRGWWNMLTRRYYENTGTDLVVTTDQIAAIVTACGQYLVGMDIETASGVSSSEYRDGDSTAQAEIISLLEVGTASYQRLLATVTRERYLRVYGEPAIGSRDYLLLGNGTLQDAFGNRLPRRACPVGVWAQPKDFLPATVDLSRLMNLPQMFIEQSEWSEPDQSLALTFRGSIKPFRIGGVDAG